MSTGGADPAIGSSVSFGPPETTLLNLAATVEVAATDPGGNVDGSPASDDWKVKKKQEEK